MTRDIVCTYSAASAFASHHADCGNNFLACFANLFVLFHLFCMIMLLNSIQLYYAVYIMPVNCKSKFFAMYHMS